jgi:hypothetical protein
VFDRILGLPAHPLLVHAAVILLPLLCLGGVLYAVAPSTRRHIRWPVAFFAVTAPIAVFVAKLSGESLAGHENLTSAEIQASISTHKSFGDVTLWLAIALGLVVLVLTIATNDRPLESTPSSSDSPSPPPGRTSGGVVLQVVFRVATVGLAAASMYYIFRTGDSGAKMVWTGF